MGEMKYSQWILKRVAIGDTLRLRAGKTTIGRLPECTIRISSSFSSRLHCIFEVDQDGRISLEDFSSNGTFVNSQCYKKEKVELYDGDRVGIGCKVSVKECREDDNYCMYILKNVPMHCREPSEENLADTECTSGNSLPSYRETFLAKDENKNIPRKGSEHGCKEVDVSPVQPSTSGKLEVKYQDEKQYRHGHCQKESDSEGDLLKGKERKVSFNQDKKLVDKQVSFGTKYNQNDGRSHKDFNNLCPQNQLEKNERCLERCPSSSSGENKLEDNANGSKKMFSNKNQLKNISKREKRSSGSRNDIDMLIKTGKNQNVELPSATLWNNAEEDGESDKDSVGFNENELLKKSRRRSDKKGDCSEKSKHGERNYEHEHSLVSDIQKKVEYKTKYDSSREDICKIVEKECRISLRKSNDNKGLSGPDNNRSSDIPKNSNPSVTLCKFKSGCKIDKVNEGNKLEAKKVLKDGDECFVKADKLSAESIISNEVRGDKSGLRHIDEIVIISDDESDENDKNFEFKRRDIEQLNEANIIKRRKSESKVVCTEEIENMELINCRREKEEALRMSSERRSVTKHNILVESFQKKDVSNVKATLTSVIAAKNPNVNPTSKSTCENPNVNTNEKPTDFCSIIQKSSNKNCNNNQSKLLKHGRTQSIEILKTSKIDEGISNKDKQDLNVDVSNIQQDDLAELDALISEIKTEIIESEKMDYNKTSEIYETVSISDDENENNIDMQLSQSLIRDIKQEMVDLELEESFGLERMKEEPGDKDNKLMSPIIEIDDDEDDFDDAVCKWAIKLSQSNFSETKSKPEVNEKRKVPEIITPPSLPTKRGKLRGKFI